VEFARRDVADAVEDTLGAILKYQDDINQVRGGGVNVLLQKVMR